MEVFYVIKVRKGDKQGYVSITPGGVKVIGGGVHADITQFKTYSAAQDSIRDNRIEKNGIRAWIVDNMDLIRDEAGKPGMQIAQKDMYYIETVTKEKVCYNPQTEAYFFQMAEVGFCCWETEQAATDFINGYFPELFASLFIKILPATKPKQ